MARALNQTLKAIYRRKFWLQLPGGVLTFIGLSLAAAGIWGKQPVAALFGLVMLGIGLILLGVASGAGWLLRK